MKRLAILLFSVTLMSYSHADNTSHKNEKLKLAMHLHQELLLLQMI